MNEIAPFTIDVAEATLEDLARRLQGARWPQHLLVAGGEDATRLHHVRRLLERWQGAFDWRAHERRLNALPQYRVTVDGIGLHVVWVRSELPDAQPCCCSTAGRRASSSTTATTSVGRSPAASPGATPRSCRPCT